MDSRSRFPSNIFGWKTSEERKIFRLQIGLLFVLSTLLFIGFPGLHEWRQHAAESRMLTIIRGWDGLAWYTWLGAAPFMLLLVQRFPLGRGQIKRNLAWLSLGSAAIYLIVSHVRYGLRVLAFAVGGVPLEEVTDFDTYVYNTFALLPLDLLTYCGFFAVSFAVDYYFKQRRQAEQAIQLQLQAARLHSDLARAELAALRGQLHPHFLFNSFNALATLVRQRKNDAAVETIAKLSALLRLAIDRSGLQVIPLEQEMDFIRRYLEIEHLRFGDKLRTEISLEPATLDVLVPGIVLQPLVENAIKHGISLRTTPGLVRISAAEADGRLRILIADDGAEGPPPARMSARAIGSKGIGLANARAQLDWLYGPDYRLELASQPGGGTTVCLELPLRRTPASPKA